ncbi:MAG: Gfo/Idh/MocA family oxidoreductase [Planctomycetes bacterium]|nr:Gfo/Idh/MocA family oxidoreductase [Planctomycetota bacterium]
MIRIGIVGIGFMGWIHYLAARGLNKAKLVAIGSRDQKKLSGDWTSIRGNFGPPGEMVDLSALKKFASFDAMLADPDIDLIDICNPTNAHPEAAIAALKAGKHVLVEKAIALLPDQADAMLAAAKKANRLLMVAHVLPFFPEFAYAAQVAREGRFGKLLGGHFKRVISRPDWSADIGDAAKTGGPAIDLHIHDTHFIGLLAGVPNAVFSTGIVEKDSVEYLTTQYLYGPGGPSITCSSGAVAMSGRQFVHGYEIYFEKATLVYESGTAPLTVYTPDGMSSQPQLVGGGDPISAFTMEIQAAVDGVIQGKMPDLLSGQLARDALVMCYKECESVKTGKIVEMS